MLYRLLCVGRLRAGPARTLTDEFLNRLRPFHTIEEIDVKAAPGDDPARAVGADTETVLRRLEPADRVWLLDRTGRELTSEELAATLTAEATAGYGRITFVIGAAYGFDHRIAERANMRWSLSRLTFLHEWARMLVAEQLYRATKIAHNQPYHH